MLPSSRAYLEAPMIILLLVLNTSTPFSPLGGYLYGLGGLLGISFWVSILKDSNYGSMFADVVKIRAYATFAGSTTFVSFIPNAAQFRGVADL
ncbi:hypothetical protein DL96DRAFT_1718717 [Flagelloscypha sp. PMI_526]|nr:hypothetical protein DL96DRAFT_1718717 [Flagelloscypha sp. PMI_526]